MKSKYIILLKYKHIYIYVNMSNICAVQMLTNFTIGKLVAKTCLESFVFSK